MGPTLLTDLPNEVIHQILQCLPPSDVPSLELVSERFRTLARESVLWQYFCRSNFRYWDQSWDIRSKLKANAANFDWKAIYSERHVIDRSTTHDIDSILSSQVGRIAKSTEIIGLGYDVKDTLIRHLGVGDDAEDVLARRFHSKAILSYMHHAAAVREWTKVRDGQDVSLERALAAFDLFVLQDEKEDFDGISLRLDLIAKQLREGEADLSDMNPRQRALAIASFLRQNKFTGVKDQAQYHALPHNFLGIALQDEEHQCLPLINVAIYCCVAQRLGLDAQPCGFPFHVHAIVKAAKGRDMDGRGLTENTEARPMYLDPWNSAEEIPQEELVAKLKEMRINPPAFTTLLEASSIADVVQRTARNILNSYSSERRASIDLPLVLSDGAFYGAVWALLILTEHNSPTASQRDRFIFHIAQHLERQFYLDAPLFDEHILSLSQDRGLHGDPITTVRDMLENDNTPKKPKSRPEGHQDYVQCKVGQVFKHKRYHYQAIVTGWDKECEAQEHWIAQMGVRNLPNGTNQAFYHVMADDESTRYVAEENIELTATDEISPTLMAIAGQYFKRWDQKSYSFVSNIKDEYPDD